jgi:hypothetical protein
MLDWCWAFDLYTSADAHLCSPSLPQNTLAVSFCPDQFVFHDQTNLEKVVLDYCQVHPIGRQDILYNKPNSVEAVFKNCSLCQKASYLLDSILVWAGFSTGVPPVTTSCSVTVPCKCIKYPGMATCMWICLRCDRCMFLHTSNSRSSIVEERILRFVFVPLKVEEQILRFVFVPSMVEEQILRFVFTPLIVRKQILRFVFIPSIVEEQILRLSLFLW